MGIALMGQEREKRVCGAHLVYLSMSCSVPQFSVHLSLEPCASGAGLQSAYMVQPEVCGCLKIYLARFCGSWLGFSLEPGLESPFDSR